MGHTYKYLGSKEQTKRLWENEEALEKYIARLKEFWDEENQCWLKSPAAHYVALDVEINRPL